MRLIDDIINKEVLDTQANILGKVKDIEIDASTKKIESVIIIKEEKKDGLFNRGNKTSEEIIPFEEVGSVGDKIILKESLNEILNMY